MDEKLPSHHKSRSFGDLEGLLNEKFQSYTHRVELSGFKVETRIAYLGFDFGAHTTAKDSGSILWKAE